jgi:hypothetical protein
MTPVWTAELIGRGGSFDSRVFDAPSAKGTSMLRPARLRQLIAIVVAALSSAACSNEPVSIAPASPGSAKAAAGISRETMDDVFENVARSDLPSFAGYYLEGDTLVVMVSDERRGAQAAALVAARSAQWHVPKTKRTVVRKVAHDYASLAANLRLALPLLGKAGIHGIDLDEKENRLLFFVDPSHMPSEAIDAAAHAGIPSGLVAVASENPPEQRIAQGTGSLSTQHDVIGGGLQVSNLDIYPYENGTCTMGFTGFRASDGAPVGVTNSHCTTQMFHTDGSRLTHPFPTNGARIIGYEIFDPSRAFLPVSDAAMFAMTSVDPGTFGRIYHPLYYTMSGPGTSIIDPDYPYFFVYGKVESQAGAPVGALLDKVGWVSGWTRGYVTNSCVYLEGLSCQWKATIHSNKGDSGSPVFFPYDDGMGAAPVILYGIVWGGPEGNFSTSYFSSFWGIEVNLGSINVCTPGLGC